MVRAAALRALKWPEGSTCGFVRGRSAETDPAPPRGRGSYRRSLSTPQPGTPVARVSVPCVVPIRALCVGLRRQLGQERDLAPTSGGLHGRHTGRQCGDLLLQRRDVRGRALQLRCACPPSHPPATNAATNPMLHFVDRFEEDQRRRHAWTPPGRTPKTEGRRASRHEAVAEASGPVPALPQSLPLSGTTRPTAPDTRSRRSPRPVRPTSRTPSLATTTGATGATPRPDVPPPRARAPRSRSP